MLAPEMASRAYVTNTSAFLPGEPVENDDIENVLGMVGGRPSRARRIVLRNNGIKKRHYVLDRTSGQPKYNNAQLTAVAVRKLENSAFASSDIECLACGTSTPDQLVPNHAVMVHGEIGNPCCEVVATAGICLAGLTAFKYGYLAVRGGQTANAVVTGSEVASLSLHARNFTSEVESRVVQLEDRPEIAFEKDFLRWMLSDGAGAMLLQDRPRSDGISLRVEWVDTFSYAHELPVCMYAGAQKDGQQKLISWRNCQPDEWLAESVFTLKQDVKLLNDNIAKYACAEPVRKLMKKRGLRAEDVDYLLPHLSSQYFREPIARAMAEIGFDISPERWFTNLAERGNTGSASPYIILDELFHSGRLKVGDRILLAVPESGRFSSGFAYFTVV
jgi:3-oxoacyl-[acyl-carrier-protein] synthase-3